MESGVRGFELIEHTADIGVVATGSSLSEAFENAACGLFYIIADLSEVRTLETRDVQVTAPDIETLLFNWLNELIYIFDVHHILFNKFEVTELKDCSLKAVCRGEKYDPSIHVLKTEVKSATLHMLRVDKSGNSVQVIFDI